MKKLFTSIFAVAMAVSAQAAPFYTAEFSTQEEFDKWLVVDANEDGKTWSFDASGDDGKKTFYTYHGTNQANDWLISPAITPQEDGKILVRFHYRGSYYGEAMKVYYGKEQSAAAMTTELGDYPDLVDNNYGSFVIIDGKKGESFHIGFLANSQPDKWRLYVQDITCETVGDNLVDLKLDEIVSPVTGKGLGEETVTLKIANCGESDVESFTVTVTADDEERISETVNQAIAKGETAEVTLTTKLDLSKPRHLYNVVATVTHPDDIEPANNSASASIRHKAPATVPYATGFEPTDYNDDHAKFDLNEDSGNWGIEVGSLWFNMARTGLGYAGYNYDKNNAGDDWLILEPINVEAGYHVLKFWYAADDSHPEKLGVYWGNEQKPEAMTNKIVEYAPFLSDGYEESINILYFDKPQTVYIGFYAFSDADQNWLTIDDVTLETIDATDIDFKIGKLSAPLEYVPQLSSKDVVLTAKCYGIQTSTAKATLYFDDAQAAEQTLEFAAQEEKTITFADALSGLAEGKHTLKVVISSEADIEPSNNELTQDIVILGAPAISYDFEDAKVPEDFKFHENNDATLAAGAVEEFGEKGWGIMNIGEHQYLGNHVLGGSTYMNDDATPDRYCILPRVHVDSEDACFVWSSGATSPYFSESYKVKASNSTDPLYISWYDNLATVNGETSAVLNRGVSLGKYKDEDIYIAINLISPNGDAAMFDNLFIYGCSPIEQSGLNSVAADSNNLMIADSKVLYTGSDATMTIYDIDGKVISSVEANAISTADLATGVYIVRAVSADGVAVKKFMKR